MTGNTDRSEGQIVVGVDGTVAATAAVRWAILEALLLEANLHLVFACDHDRLSRAPYAGRSGAPGPDGNNAAGTVLFDAGMPLRRGMSCGGCSSLEGTVGRGIKITRLRFDDAASRSRWWRSVHQRSRPARSDHCL